WGTNLVCRSLSSGGIRAEAIPPANEEDLKRGRGNSSCKECLPLQLTIGSMLRYLDNRDPGEITLYFMPSAGGPCRFGQYEVFSRKLIERKQVPDATVFSTSSKEGYGGLGQSVTLRAWRSIVIGDLLEEMQATVLAGAEDREEGFAILEREYQNILNVVDREWTILKKQLRRSAKALQAIKFTRPYNEIPKISLVGEIFVRHDPIARQGLVERLADKGFIVRTSQVTEWMKYTDWLVRSKVEGRRDLGFWISTGVKWYFDREIRRLLAPSGLFYDHAAPTRELIACGKPYISPRLNGEAILTVGAAFHEILEPACGIISIGPFGCMPSRVAESILSDRFTTSELRLHKNGLSSLPLLKQDRKLPFLAIETDGNPFPQIIEARLEAFCLQAERLNRELLSA
ncbi:MAG: activase, partial [Desulfovibrionales bacterium]